MAEVSYKQECARAELLGLEAPDREEFIRNFKEPQKTEEDEDIERLKEAASTTEGFKHVQGRLAELNSLLVSTQKKIKNFRGHYGSFSKLLNIKIGRGSVEETPPPRDNKEILKEDANTASPSGHVDYKKSDLTTAVDNHVDKLDTLLYQMDDAHYSMSSQNREMKKFLK